MRSQESGRKYDFLVEKHRKMAIFKVFCPYNRLNLTSRLKTDRQLQKHQKMESLNLIRVPNVWRIPRARPGMVCILLD